MVYRIPYFVKGVINMSKNKFNNSNNEMYFKILNKLKNSPEYKQNQMQINCITKILVEHADIPPKLINWLIDSVQKNVVLEYELLKEFKI